MCVGGGERSFIDNQEATEGKGGEREREATSRTHITSITFLGHDKR